MSKYHSVHVGSLFELCVLHLHLNMFIIVIAHIKIFLILVLNDVYTMYYIYEKSHFVQ